MLQPVHHELAGVLGLGSYPADHGPVLSSIYTT
jgi:hypothetical protein